MCNECAPYGLIVANNLFTLGRKKIGRGAMTIFELVKNDKEFIKASNAILYRMCSVFLVLYYGLSSLGIYTKVGRQAVDYLGLMLPGILRHQYDLLRGIDGSSHAPYLLMFPTIFGVGAYYFYCELLNVRAFSQRNRQWGESSDELYRMSVVAILASISMLPILAFSGSITVPDEGMRMRPWLIWPVSGFIPLSSLGMFLMGAKMYLVARTFRSNLDARS